jgi:hypothetical protein
VNSNRVGEIIQDAANLPYQVNTNHPFFLRLAPILQSSDTQALQAARANSDEGTPLTVFLYPLHGMALPS